MSTPVDVMSTPMNCRRRPNAGMSTPLDVMSTPVYGTSAPDFPWLASAQPGRPPETGAHTCAQTETSGLIKPGGG